MSAVDPQGDETFWIEGIPFQGIRTQSTKTGQQKYYVNGEVTSELFPFNNADTGKFFFLFED